MSIATARLWVFFKKEKTEGNLHRLNGIINRVVRTSFLLSMWRFETDTILKRMFSQLLLWLIWQARKPLGLRRISKKEVLSISPYWLLLILFSSYPRANKTSHFAKVNWHEFLSLFWMEIPGLKSYALLIRIKIIFQSQ